MAKQAALFLLLLLINISFPASASAQNGAVNYRVPRLVDLEPAVRRTLKKHFRGDGRTSPITEAFYPIGWSRDGKFAYYVEPVDEACGCYFAELRIQDLRTDEIVWQFKNDPESRVGADGSPIDDDINKLWRRNQKLFNAKLNEHKIVAAKFVLLGRDFMSAGKRYTTKLTTRTEFDEDFGLDRVRSVKLDLTAATLGNKTIFAAEDKDEKFLSPLATGIVGALKSPFENRAAIVMVNVQRGWEGPPHTVDVRLIGADLKNGFKK